MPSMPSPLRSMGFFALLAGQLWASVANGIAVTYCSSLNTANTNASKWNSFGARRVPDLTVCRPLCQITASTSRTASASSSASTISLLPSCKAIHAGVLMSHPAPRSTSTRTDATQSAPASQTTFAEGTACLATLRSTRTPSAPPEAQEPEPRPTRL